jgi:hypothetical protein
MAAANTALIVMGSPSCLYFVNLLFSKISVVDGKITYKTLFARKQLDVSQLTSIRGEFRGGPMRTHGYLVLKTLEGRLRINGFMFDDEQLSRLEDSLYAISRLPESAGRNWRNARRDSRR